ncbi:hypothetical protein GE061_007392 [Apolygus lucorum]|uniref:Uncharacterized protein n=1 Tax=Apolygus lucorum TaxID=248454 RepID=A0A8S9WU65_APOLU|nr:hypothetical protein GE061_007392 [Apolygus lucorum]
MELLSLVFSMSESLFATSMFCSSNGSAGSPSCYGPCSAEPTADAYRAVFLCVSLLASVPITNDDIDFIIYKFREWGSLYSNTPKIDVVTEGKVVRKKHERTYKFKFIMENGLHCTGLIYMNTNGRGKHGWNCRGKEWKAKPHSGHNRLLLLSCIFVLSESRSLNKKDKKYLIGRVSEWDNAPDPVKIAKGTVTTKHGAKKYKFVYKTEDGSSCDAELDVKKSGKGHYSWQCVMTDKLEDEDYDEDDEMRRRQLRKKKKPSVMKGTGVL